MTWMPWEKMAGGFGAVPGSKVGFAGFGTFGAKRKIAS